MANNAKGTATQKATEGKARLDAFVSAIKACDTAASHVTDKAREAAALLTTEHMVGLEDKGVKEQHEKLMERAKEMVQDAKYKLVNPDLFSRYISPLVLCNLTADVPMKRKVKTDEGETLEIDTTVGELTKGSIKSAQKIAKDMRDRYGMSDGRSSNTGKRKARQPGAEVTETAVIASLSSDRAKLKSFLKDKLVTAEGEREVTEVLHELGFSLRKMSKLEIEGLPETAPKKAPAKKAPAEKKAATAS